MGNLQKDEAVIEPRRFGTTAFAILAAWALLIFLYRLPSVSDLPETFPMSMFDGPRIVWQGLPYAAVFLSVLWLALRTRSTAARAWLIAVALLILGNMVQGGFVLGFIRPLAQKAQYAVDVVRIENWVEWLRSFNANQGALSVHSRSHPPFAVLLHYAMGSAVVASIVFTALAALSFVLVERILRVLEVGEDRVPWLVLLFAVFPAVNIYGAVVLDSVILTTATLFLLGLVRLMRAERWDWWGFAAFAGGFLATNALSFGGVFLLGVAAFWSIRHRRVRTALLAALGLSAIAYVALRLGLGYDHVEAFLTSSRLENPDGFRAFATPAHYLLTRIENVGDILLFLSVPALAVFLRRRPEAIGLTAMVVLGAMFLSGAFRTGETARACLFIYPYLLLSFRGLSAGSLRWLVALAGLQTLAMQVLGHYYW